jgi:hypothetical protein
MNHATGANTVVQIDSVPAIAADQILLALSAEGVAGAVVDSDSSSDSGLELSVRSGDDGSLERRVSSALDRLVAEQPRSLIPERVGPLSFSVHPPAG